MSEDLVVPSPTSENNSTSTILRPEVSPAARRPILPPGDPTPSPTEQVVQLMSILGDGLHRPDAPQGVTTWGGGIGNRWTLVPQGERTLLRSWKGDYLHRPDTASGVTTWHTGIGNEWVLEPMGSGVRLKSWKGDYLMRMPGGQGVTTGEFNPYCLWTLQQG